MKILKRITFTLLILILPPIIIARDVYQFSQIDQTRPADAAIVLGAGVIRGRPSAVLRARINHAIQLYEDGYVEKIIFTGGVGRRDTLSEAEVARNYAVAQGLPANVLLMEKTSTNTAENLANAQTIANEYELETFLIVSTPFHMKRAISLADDLGLDASPSPTRTIRWINGFTRTYAFLREVAAYGVYLVSK